MNRRAFLRLIGVFSAGAAAAAALRLEPACPPWLRKALDECWEGGKTLYIEDGKCREDLADLIYNISPTDMPFMDLVADGRAPGVYYDWSGDALKPAPIDFYSGEFGEKAVVSGFTGAQKRRS